jgi:hypothetical protein
LCQFEYSPPRQESIQRNSLHLLQLRHFIVLLVKGLLLPHLQSFITVLASAQRPLVALLLSTVSSFGHTYTFELDPQELLSQSLELSLVSVENHSVVSERLELILELIAWCCGTRLSSRTLHKEALNLLPEKQIWELPTVLVSPVVDLLIHKNLELQKVSSHFKCS